MQELIVNGLLAVVILTALFLLLLVGGKPNSGMTKKQKVMLGRILIAACCWDCNPYRRSFSPRRTRISSLGPGVGCVLPSI